MVVRQGYIFLEPIPGPNHVLVSSQAFAASTMECHAAVEVDRRCSIVTSLGAAQLRHISIGANPGSLCLSLISPHSRVQLISELGYRYEWMFDPQLTEATISHPCLAF